MRCPVRVSLRRKSVTLTQAEIWRARRAAGNRTILRPVGPPEIVRTDAERARCCHRGRKSFVWEAANAKSKGGKERVPDS